MHVPGVLNIGPTNLTEQSNIEFNTIEGISVNGVMRVTELAGPLSSKSQTQAIPLRFSQSQRRRLCHVHRLRCRSAPTAALAR